MSFFEWGRELMSYFEMGSRDEKGWEPLQSIHTDNGSVMFEIYGLNGTETACLSQVRSHIGWSCLHSIFFI